jgi:hypothetical protein
LSGARGRAPESEKTLPLPRARGMRIEPPVRAAILLTK